MEHYDEFDDKFKTVNVGEFFDFVSAPTKNKKRENKVCPVCGYHQEQFLQTGFLGCSECYKHLYSTIEPAILRLFGKTEHNSYENFDDKTAENATNIAQSDDFNKKLAEQELTSLESMLKMAVANENYEKAAVIKRKIEELKGENDG